MPIARVQTRRYSKELSGGAWRIPLASSRTLGGWGCVRVSSSGSRVLMTCPDDTEGTALVRVSANDLQSAPDKLLQQRQRTLRTELL